MKLKNKNSSLLNRCCIVLPGALTLSMLFSGCISDSSGIASLELERTCFTEIITASGTIRSTSTLTIVAPRVRASNMTVIYLADDGSHVKAGDTICILDAPDLASQYEDISSKLEQTQLDLNKLIIDTDVNLSSLESQMEEMEIRVALNSLDSIQRQFAPPVRQRLFALELEKAGIEKTKLQKKYDAEKQIFDADRRRIESLIKSIENDLQRIVDQINTLTVTAPRDGMVMHTEAPRMTFMSSMGSGIVGGKIAVNSSVWSNMALLQVPDLREMEVIAEVPEVEYRRILPGQKVNIHVDALNNLKITGEIKRKTLAGRTPDQQSAIKLYEIIVGIDSLHSLLTPGLSAGCRIMVSQVADTVVVPTMAIFEKDNLNIIYVAEGKKFKPVPVETGLSNSTSTIVRSGLKGNETIALVEPPFRMINRTSIATGLLPNYADTLNAGETVKNPSTILTE
jgi:HlyD family secretion protein